MKKILFLSNRLPYPPTSGGAIKRWKVVEYLSEHHDLGIVTVLAEADPTHVDEFTSKIRLSHFHGEVLDRKRNVWNLLLSYLHGLPLSYYRNYSPSLKKHVRQVAENYDALLLDSSLMFPYAPRDCPRPVLLHEHNAEYVIWSRFCEVEKNVLKKMILLIEARRIKNAERDCCKTSCAIFAAPNDIQSLAGLGIPRDKFIETYHLGNEEHLDLPDIDFHATEKALLFVGTPAWEPNLDGLTWFISQVWDTLKARHPDLTFFVVGREPGARLRNLVRDRKDIRLTGFVEDLEPYYSRCRVFVAPLRFGAGMKVKIIDAMYRGVPVVTTAVGAEGLGVEDGEHLFVSDTADNMAADTCELLQNERTWTSIRDRSRTLARERYRWDRVFYNLESGIRSCLESEDRKAL
ncbi:MAG: glycosyltransferase [Deltaproteobacteria bacterium]|nr:glycosyltransferase [Deltaproteobacteria bacterium]